MLRLISSGEGYDEISRKIGHAATADILNRPRLKGNLPKTILAEKTLRLIRSKKRLSDYDIEGLRALATDLGLMKSKVIGINPMKKSTKTSAADSHLEPFGAAVIQIMEADTDWGPDTAEKIQAAAAELGLATSDRAGYFKRTTQGKSSGTSQLARFAEYVLKTLETSKDWNADTADLIAVRAMDAGLAVTGRDGMFEGTSKAMRRNPARSESFKRGDLVIGIMGVDGGYVGTVTKVSTDSRGRQLVTYKDSDSGKERVTFAFNLSKDVPEKGRFPRKNPIAESGSLSKKGDRKWFWVDDETMEIHTYSKDSQQTGRCLYYNDAALRSAATALEKEGYVRSKNPWKEIEKQAADASKRLEGFYARKNPRKFRVTRTNPVISLEEYKP